MIKNITNLTKIFFKNSLQNPFIIDKKTGKINKKSIFLWLLIIVAIALAIFSHKIINVMVKLNQEKIFLSLFFLFINIIMIFQVSLASITVYFNSKELEDVLPFPFKPHEILIAKFNSIVLNLYFSELIFALLPLIIFGIIKSVGILYYIWLLGILIIFPIMTVAVVSIITMLLMKIFKFIRNKDVLQIVITLLFVICVCTAEAKILGTIFGAKDNNKEIDESFVIEEITKFNNKTQNINNYLLIINPSVEILNDYKNVTVIINLIKITSIDLAVLIIFIFIGKKYYLKNILSNINYNYNKKVNIEKLKKKIKKKSIFKSYLKKELKIIFKTPAFLIQCIFPTFILGVTILLLGFALGTNIQKILEAGNVEEGFEIIINLRFITIVLILIQILFTISNISISAISREGNNIKYMKLMPLSYFKQFNYKIIPQIIINMILIIFFLIFIKLAFPMVTSIDLLFIFILGNLLNILNSIIMVLADLYKPNLNWTNENDAVKNGNSIVKYSLTIILILIINYLYKIFSDINLNATYLIFTIIFIVAIAIIEIIIKYNINRLFNKIDN